VSGDAVLEIRDVDFAYVAHHRVLEAISGRVTPGRLLVVLGPNGCGKTTLIEVLLGSLRPDRGEVRLLGKPHAAWRPAERAAHISFVPQTSSPGFAYSTRQVVELGRYALASDPPAIDRALADVALDDSAARAFHELSAGQRQRALFARALYQTAAGGRVMLLDEPVSAMDLYWVHATLRRLRELAAGGLAVVVVLQDLSLAARYADDVWLLAEGRIVAAGPWSEVLDPARLSSVYGLPIVREEPVANAGDDDEHAEETARRPRFDARWK